jgi:methylenetetrahydrofolate--tRNA-(uracil-5-)-methyltransferase
MKTHAHITVIGGGLAGSEAAWQIARRGIPVHLYEMRPEKSTGAHATDYLAELVCSNSLGSAMPDRASGLLKEELRRMNSLLIACADRTAVPAGGALAVDRDAFAREITGHISRHPLITLIRREMQVIPDSPTIIASGPLTSDPLAEALTHVGGEDHLFFFDAISPIVSADSIDMSKAFRASRRGRGETEEGDYVNCPLNRETYERFVDALIRADRIPLHTFELAMEQGVRAGMHTFFEGCLPIEILAGRGKESLAFGPMRPIGLVDPRTNHRPYAVLQLRQDNLAASLYNMVGFQTNLRFPEQKRVFGLIPGLEQAEYVRFGQMHRNTFIASPLLLHPTLQFRSRHDLFCAGQLTGVEGYAGNIATGLLAGINAARLVQRSPPLSLPRDTMLGALCAYVTQCPMKDFQPMKANFGIMPPLDNTHIKGKRARASAYAERSLEKLDAYLKEIHYDREI